MTTEFPPVEWSKFRSCRVCKATPGEPCLALSGRVAGGRPDGVPVLLPHPHGTRRRRAGAAGR